MQRADCRILLADDDANERELFLQIFRSVLGQAGRIQDVADGEEAIRYMVGQGRYADRSIFPFPSLLIVDLQMPRVDGLGVLEFVRANPAWSVVPRIVLSSSDDDDDVKKSYMLGASAVHKKPWGMAELKQMLEGIVLYWRTAESARVDRDGRLLMTNSDGRIGHRYRQAVGGGVMVRP